MPYRGAVAGWLVASVVLALVAPCVCAGMTPTETAAPDPHECCNDDGWRVADTPCCDERSADEEVAFVLAAPLEVAHVAVRIAAVDVTAVTARPSPPPSTAPALILRI